MNKKLAVIVFMIVLAILASVLYSSYTAMKIPVINNGGTSPYTFAVYTKAGDIVYINEAGALKKNLIGSYFMKIGGYKILDPVGIIENPPKKSITDIYGKILESMDKNKNVLVIYIDGLGYEAYRKAADCGVIPYISSLGSGTRANTVYPSITDVGFASMVTGRTPKHTGIHSREKKPLTVPTIFDAAAERGKRALLIEGNIRIIIDEVKTVLNIDEDKNGTIDDEIYERTLMELKDPPGLLLVHLHSYDDMGHKYGPDSEEAGKQLAVLDTYIQDILREYTGAVIITADHGMHGTESGGRHGAFSAEDMFVPIITADFN